MKMPSTAGKRAQNGEMSSPPTKRQKRQSAAKEIKYQESSEEDDEQIGAAPKRSKLAKSPRRKTQRKAAQVANEDSDEIIEAEPVKTNTKKSPKKAASKAARTTKTTEDDSPAKAIKVTKITKKKTESNGVKVETELKQETTEVDGTAVDEKTTVKRKRKTTEEKESETMPLAARTIGSKILVGAHVSAAGGAQNAIPNIVRIGGNAFSLFLKSQRKWAFTPLSDEHQTQFLSNCKHHNLGHEDNSIAPIVPHGSYLVNLAHTDEARATQAYDTFIDDLSRCHKLGITLYNFHPGNASGADSRAEALAHIAKQLNKSHADPKSGQVVILLETMAAFGGNTIGTTFEELAEIIGHVDDKSRVGVCLDTCHVFAAGYDLRTPDAYEEVIEKFDKAIGLKYLRALHVNDSKAPLNSGRDLHANIGTGFLGLRAFHNLVNDQRMWGLPLILETPIDVKNKDGKAIEDHAIWAREIKLLESLVGMDVESQEFTRLESELFAQGKSERDRLQEQVDKKASRVTKKKK